MFYYCVNKIKYFKKQNMKREDQVDGVCPLICLYMITCVSPLLSPPKMYFVIKYIFVIVCIRTISTGAHVDVSVFLNLSLCVSGKTSINTTEAVKLQFDQKY